MNFERFNLTISSVVLNNMKENFRLKTCLEVTFCHDTHLPT